MTKIQTSICLVSQIRNALTDRGRSSKYKLISGSIIKTERDGVPIAIKNAPKEHRCQIGFRSKIKYQPRKKKKTENEYSNVWMLKRAWLTGTSRKTSVKNWHCSREKKNIREITLYTKIPALNIRINISRRKIQTPGNRLSKNGLIIGLRKCFLGLPPQN